MGGHSLRHLADHLRRVGRLRERVMVDQHKQLKEIAADCREAARIYENRPGLVGPGANAGTICDLYSTIAVLIDQIIALRGDK
jgi:hypothetical protein